MNSYLSSLRTTVLKTSIFFSAVIAMPLAGHAQSSLVLVSAPLPLQTTTTIPGRTLKPGTYSIRVLDHFKDRFILRIDDVGGKPLATFIGLRNPEFVDGHGQGPITWASAPHGAEALRGFSFANGTTLEFVYPKGQAAELAKLNTSSVPAIDPESEGRPADPKLPNEDRQVVTLWMLSATRVGPKNETPAIAAKRFQPEENAQIASNSEPAPLVNTHVRAASGAVKGPISTADSVPAVEKPAPAPKVKHVIARLPQTGSEFPLILLISMLFLGGALSLSGRRRTS